VALLGAAANQRESLRLIIILGAKNEVRVYRNRADRREGEI
jgi:hypothetical protein